MNEKFHTHLILEIKRAWRASIPRPATQEATTLSILRHKPSTKNTCNNLSLIKLTNFLLNVNNLPIMFC